MSADDLRPLREAYAAKPAEVIDHHMPMPDAAALLTRSRVVLMGSGDQRPPVRRPGSMDFAALPSGGLRWQEPQP